MSRVFTKLGRFVHLDVASARHLLHTRQLLRRKLFQIGTRDLLRDQIHHWRQGGRTFSRQIGQDRQPPHLLKFLPSVCFRNCNSPYFGPSEPHYP